MTITYLYLKHYILILKIVDEKTTMKINSCLIELIATCPLVRLTMMPIKKTKYYLFHT